MSIDIPTDLGYQDRALEVFRTPARADTDSWVSVVANISKLAQQVASTEFVPRALRDNVPATAAAILYGREIGLPPMTALTQIHVIEGRPGISAEGMRSLVYAAGHELVFDEATTAVCRMRARRAHSEHWTVLEWTIDQARAAKLLHKDNWQKYARSMLIARCTTDLCRMVFPDVIHGFGSVEELTDLDPTAPPANIPRRAGTRSTVQRRRSTDAESPAPASDDRDAPPLASSPGRSPALPGEDGPGVPDDAGSAPNETASSGNKTDPDPLPRVNKATQKIQMMQFRRLGVEERAERLRISSEIIGRTLGTSWDETPDEADRINLVLSVSRDLGALWEQLSATTDEEQAGDPVLPLIPGEPDHA